jgi:hypothetical protein
MNVGQALRDCRPGFRQAFPKRYDASGPPKSPRYIT